MNSDKRKFHLRQQMLTYFERGGYSFSQDFLDDLKKAEQKVGRRFFFYQFIHNWIITKQNMQFTIRPYSTGSQKHRRHWYGVSVQMPEEVSQQLDLVIEPRGIISKVLGTNKGDFHHLQEALSIRSSNVMLVKDLINNRANLLVLQQALSYTTIDVDRSMSFRVSQNFSPLLTACNAMVALVAIIQDYVAHTARDRYTIDEIFSDLTINTELSCCVCFQPVEMQSVRAMACCSSLGHYDHLMDWLSKKNSCPYCRTADVTLLKPILN